MEGYLKKWVNLRWQPRYFVLHGEVLLYCEKEGSSAKGQIHLKVASIILVPEDPLLIILNTGTSEMHLRAQTVAEKIKWVSALKAAQEHCLERDTNYPKAMINNKIYDTLADIWCTQAQCLNQSHNYPKVDEVMSNLIPKLEKNSEVKNLSKRLEQLARTLKNKVTLCTQMLEEEQKKNEFLNNNNFQQQDNDTIYQSFIQSNSSQIIMEDISYQFPVQFSGNKYNIQQILDQVKHLQPIKYKNLINNPVFKQAFFTDEFKRFKLPRIQDPKEKLNLWRLIKDLVGKDLTRFAVPVYLNEPTSMLQRLSEELEYHESLEKANQENDSGLRMCYIMGFAISQYAININRHKKPFNPILGETYELQNPNFTFISEQVSHHPPISAGYAFSKDFEFWGITNVKSRFLGKMMEVKPMGTFHVVLKKNNDHFTYSKATTKVQNMIVGELYLDHVGDMIFTNHKTNEKGILTLHEKGWYDKVLTQHNLIVKTWHRMTGIVRDASGNQTFKLEGHWDNQLIATNLKTQEQTLVWKRHPLPENSDQYYHFTEFVMNLNFLNAQMIKELPCTDCRLRPDQYALEIGWFDLASQEKFRLEEKQRARRKELLEKNEVHIPRFFMEQDDPITLEKTYIYKGNYFEFKKSGQEGLDLF